MPEGEQAKDIAPQDSLILQDSRAVKILDAWVPWMLVMLGTIFFAGAIFSDRNFYFRDILNFHYPLRRVAIDAWARGEFPLWNPCLYFGQPMLANPNYMAFYPTNLFHLIFSFGYAFKLHFIIHPLFAGPGLYLLLRRLGILPLAAMSGAVAYQFSGTLLSFLNLYNILPAVALLPWIGWAFLGAIQGNRLRRILVLGCLLALQIFALEPLMLQCDLLLISGLGVLHWVQARDRGRAALEVLGTGTAGILFALGLAAVQIFPTLEMLPLSVRGPGNDFSLASRWSMHPMDFLNVIFPNVFGNPFSIGYATSWGEAYHHEDLGILVSFFVGCGTILLATISIMSPRKQIRTMLCVLGAGGMVLSLGRFTPVYTWLWEHVPWFRLGRYPAKYFLLVNLVLCVLAALGLEALLERAESRAKAGVVLAIGAIGSVLGAILVGAAFYWRGSPEALAGWIRSQVVPQLMAAKAFGEIQAQLLTAIASSGAFLILGGALLLLSGYWIRPALQGGLWLVLLMAELIPAGLGLVPLVSGTVFDLVPEIDQYLLAHGPKQPYRVVAPNWLPAMPNRLLAPNRSLAWTNLYERMTSQTMGGIPQGIQYSMDRSVDLLNTADSDELYRRCLLLSEPDRLRIVKKLNSPIVLSIGAISDPDLQLLASFDTRSDYRLHAFLLADALPRAYFASKVLNATDHDDALKLMLRPQVSLRDAVILETPMPSIDSGPSAGGNVTILSYLNQRVLCTSESNVPGYVVLLDSFYPGWRALVDGKEVEIRRANYCFRAVPVPEGRHEIEFVYRPRPFKFGMAVTLLTAVLGLACAMIERMRRRQKGG